MASGGPSSSQSSDLPFGFGSTVEQSPGKAQAEKEKKDIDDDKCEDEPNEEVPFASFSEMGLKRKKTQCCHTSGRYAQCQVRSMIASLT